MKFRKKPVVIEAVQWTGRNVEEIGKFLKGPVMGRGNDSTISICTLEGEMIAQPGDWIIKGVKGEFYPCKPDIFAATYEPVDDDSAPPAREETKFPAPFEGCDHTAPERVEACWHAQLCPICATKNWHAAQRELEQLRSAPPAREDVPPAMRRLVAIVSDLDARGEVEPIVVDGVRAVVRERLTTPASEPEEDQP